MNKRVQYRRLILLALLLAVAFAGLGYRLVDLQVLRHEELRAKAEQNTRRQFMFEPRRGDILDAKGNLLATSIFARTVCADPTLLGSRQADVARALAPLLQMPEGELHQRLLPRIRSIENGETNYSKYVVLKRKVPVETWEKIQKVMSGLTFGVDEQMLTRSERNFYRTLRTKAIYAQDYPVREYPNKNLAAHVLGYASTEDVEFNNHFITQISGKDGIELTLNSQLSGVPGWRLTETDRRGRELVGWREQDVEPRDGLNVVLTIDAFIQHITESALAEAMEKHKPVSVTAIVMRPRTGEILAMAQLPAFNPNSPAGAGTPVEARKNRNIADMVEPGSTFKIVVVSGALSEKLIDLNDLFDCERGHFYYGGRTLHDHDPYGVLSVESIITKSSNIGAAKIGIRLGENRLYDYVRGFGFGERTGIPLPGEIGCKNFVVPPAKWSKVSIAQIPMGHGIGVTRLQMMMAMCAIANDGRLMRPMLVDRLQDREGHVIAKYSPQMVRPVINESAAREMVKALKTVVSPEGTAPNAALQHYTVAGKTGTAQKVENGTYVHGKYLSSFIGFFPADNPELCISVVFDEPKNGYYGGQVAAPYFKQIAERAANYLNIRPDIEVPLQTPDARLTRNP